MILEALARLKSIGLIHTRQGSGVFAMATGFLPLQFDAGLAALAVTMRMRSKTIEAVHTIAKSGPLGFDVSAWSNRLKKSSVMQKWCTPQSHAAQTLAFSMGSR